MKRAKYLQYFALFMPGADRENMQVHDEIKYFSENLIGLLI
jgi:hypothetical protein